MEHDFGASWYQSALRLENDTRRKQLAKEFSSSTNDNTDSETADSKNKGPCSLVRDTCILLRFRASRHLRSLAFLAPRMAPIIAYALLLWSVYAGIGSKVATDPKAAQSLSGLFFVTVVLCGYGASPFVPSICLDRPIFYRDRADGYYGSGAYVLAKLVEDATTLLVASPLFSVIVFYGCELQGSFGVFFAVHFFASLVGVAIAYWSAAVSPNMAFACALLPAVVTICQFMSGYLIVFASIPAGWRWFYHINFIQYGFTALMMNQYAQQPSLVANGQLELYVPGGNVSGTDPGFCIAMLACITCATLLLTTITLIVLKHGSR